VNLDEVGSAASLAGNNGVVVSEVINLESSDVSGRGHAPSVRAARGTEPRLHHWRWYTPLSIGLLGQSQIHRTLPMNLELLRARGEIQPNPELG
jgi:hypothetical protein